MGTAISAPETSTAARAGKLARPRHIQPASPATTAAALNWTARATLLPTPRRRKAPNGVISPLSLAALPAANNSGELAKVCR